MSSHVYHEIYLHLNWHVKDDKALLTPELEPIVHQNITDRIHRTNGVWLHGINGTETHIHLAINIEPQVCISELVKELKGGCSFDTNQKKGPKTLEWQRGYGVVSFGMNNLPGVLEYIANQKEHHAKGKAIDRLEKCDRDEEEELKTVEKAGASEDEVGRPATKPAKAGWWVFDLPLHQLKLVANGESAEADGFGQGTPTSDNEDPVSLSGD